MNFFIVSFLSLADKRSLVAALRPYKLQKFLRERGHQVEIITPTGEQDELIINESKLVNSFRFLFKPFPPDYSIFWSIRIMRIMRKEWKNKPFYLFTTCPPYGIGVLGLLLKWSGVKFKWICDFRDLWIGNPLYRPPVTKRFLNPWFEKMFYKHCDLMVFNTSWDLAYNVSRYPILQSKSIFVRNGFDAVSKNISANDFRFVYAGGTTKGEATPYVIEVLKLLQDAGIDASCDFYGEFDEALKSSPLVKYHGIVASTEIPSIISRYKFGFIYLPSGCEDGGRVAQKFYDYLGAGVIPVCFRPSEEMVKMMDDFNTGVKIFDDTPDAELVQKIRQANFNASEVQVDSLTRNKQFEKLYQAILKL